MAMSCPSCGAALDVAVTPGATIECSKCGKRLRARAPGQTSGQHAVAAAPAPAPAEDQAAEPDLPGEAGAEAEPEPQPARAGHGAGAQRRGERTTGSHRAGARGTGSHAAGKRTTGSSHAAGGSHRGPTGGHARDHAHEAKPAKSRKPLVFAGVGAVVVIGAVAFFALGGPKITDEDKTAAYVAGYLAGARSRIETDLRASPKAREAASKEYAAGAGDKAAPADFDAGFDDARKAASPARNEAKLRGRLYDADAAVSVTEAQEKAAGKDAAKIWELAGTVGALADKWKVAAPKSEVETLQKRRDTLVSRALDADPDFADARKARGEVKYANDLQDYVAAGYLEDASRTKARIAHNRILAKAESNRGWVTPADLSEIPVLQAQFAKEKLDYEAREKARSDLLASPFHKDSEALKEKFAKELTDVMAKAKTNTERILQDAPAEARDALKQAFARFTDEITFEAVTAKPYVVFVQKSASWDAANQSIENVQKPLSALNASFLREYQQRFQLPELEKPVPVVYFRSSDAYQQYFLGKVGSMVPMVAAHFEPESGTLFVPADAQGGFTTMLHEGTHQLFHYYRKAPPEFKAQAFWFEEGVAEWFSGCQRRVNPQTKEWDYEIGLLQEERFKGIRKALKGEAGYSPLTLKELIGATYSSRDAWGRGEVHKIGLTYAQGWMLIYFLNYFLVDDKGVIQIDTRDKPVRGKYKDGWDKYLEFEICGKNGKPYTGKAAFMEALQLDDEKFKQMEKEFAAYQQFVVRKIELLHIIEKRFVPWDKARSKRGDPTGTAEDDLLYPPPSNK